jgi:hypothetical protein
MNRILLIKKKAKFTSKASKLLFIAFVVLFILLLFNSFSTKRPEWFKGNLHTHTFWSDGDEFPEIVVQWYKENGYDFLALTDHNVILEGERWRTFPDDHAALHKYIDGMAFARGRRRNKTG